MKNITAFTVLVIIFFAVITNNSAYSQEKKKESKYGFSIGPQFGFLYGQSLELVYPTDSKGELLSELRWDMKPVFYSGAMIDFGLTDIMSGLGFFSTVSFKAGFGGDSGVMEDRDWKSQENGDLTNFSSHTNKTNEFFWLEFTAGASIPFEPYFYIKPLLSGSWIRFSFTARDGYTKYARQNTAKPETYYPIDDDPQINKVPTGNCISYLQDWLLVCAGFEIGTKYFHPFSFAFSFKISPHTFSAGKDEHILMQEIHLDYTEYGLFIEPGSSFSFTSGRVDFSLDMTYHFIGKTRGEAYLNKSGSDKYYLESSKSGAGLSLFDMRVFAKFRI